MSTTPSEVTKGSGETRNVAVDFGGKLDSGEVLTGTPTVVELTSADLTLSNKAVNTVAKTVNGRSCAIGEVVQFKVVGGTAGTTYTIRVTVSTAASPAQTFVEDIRIAIND